MFSSLASTCAGPCALGYERPGEESTTCLPPGLSAQFSATDTGCPLFHHPCFCWENLEKQSRVALKPFIHVIKSFARVFKCHLPSQDLDLLNN